MKLKKITSALLLALLFAPAVSYADALTLHDALAEAYLHNPELEAERAQLRSLDENYVQAQAGFKPTVDGNASYTSAHREYDGGVTGNSDPKTLGLEVTQPIFNGGSTLAAVRQAEKEVMAERAQLHATEQRVLLSGVVAYMNLIRDHQTLQLQLNNEKVLASHLQASNERFNLGDITKTDVSQSESRYARAIATRIAAESEVKKSQAAFERVIGRPAQHLQKPAVTFNFPASEEEAILVGMDKNPSIALAKYTEGAAADSTRSIEGERLPQIDVTGGVSRTYDPAALASEDEDTRILLLRATVPLYQGGALASRIRQSKQEENRLRMETLSAERVTRQAIIAAREELAASEAETAARDSQIKAAGVALEGVKVEADYGSRSILDLLDAQQEYLDAQVAYISAETDRIIASYGLLAALGGLTAQNLQLKVPVYNPVENFQKVSSGGISWPFHGDK